MATRQQALRNFILLPTQRLPTADGASSTPRTFLEKLQVGVTLNVILQGNIPPEAVVIDSAPRTGAKLVRLPEEAVAELRAAQPGLRIVPEVFYTTQRYRPVIRQKLRATTQQQRLVASLRFEDKSTGQPVPNAQVIAFTDFAEGVGAQGVTNANGEVRLNGISGKIDQLYVYPEKNYWSLWRTDLSLTPNNVFLLEPVRLDYPDARRYFYPDTKAADGAGVRVGVIDTGTGPHPDLTVAGGRCTVTGEDPDAYADVDQHGTHVGGIIGARGAAPAGYQGVAPGVELYAYRVFGRGSGGASNFAIIKAIELAAADGCDLINMSLGGGPPDEALQDAITYAFNQGTVSLAATGNDGRQPVSFPASFSLTLAVGAMGRQNTFSADTTDAPNVAAPYGADRKNFVAAFSNVGPEVDLIAPGVGILSTVPGGYAPMSGTSMACPMATGLAARLLAANPDLLSLPRSADRSEQIIRFISAQARSLGFGPLYEGLGILQNPTVMAV